MIGPDPTPEQTALTCGCPGEVLLGHTKPCDSPATQEDLLCDWCRARDCPTVDAWNVLPRDCAAYATLPALF